MAEKTTPDITVIKGGGIYKEAPLVALDVYGNGSVKPGYLLERAAAGEVKPHATATGLAAPVMIAVERGFPTDAESGDVDGIYDQDGEMVRYIIPEPGSVVQVWLAAGYDTVNDFALLASNGNGTFRVSSTNPVLRALQDIDNDPGTGGAAVRILAEVL